MKRKTDKVVGTSKDRVWIYGDSLSHAEEIYDGAIVKFYRIVKVYDERDNSFIGYSLNMGCKDIDDPDWKEKGFIPCNTQIVTKDLDALEDMLAGIVPDSTYPGTTTIQFKWHR